MSPAAPRAITPGRAPTFDPNISRSDEAAHRAAGRRPVNDPKTGTVAWMAAQENRQEKP